MLKTIAAGTAGAVVGMLTGAVLFGSGMAIGYVWRDIDNEEKRKDKEKDAKAVITTKDPTSE